LRWARHRVARTGGVLDQPNLIPDPESDNVNRIGLLCPEGENTGSVVSDGILKDQDHGLPERARSHGQENRDAKADEQSLLHLPKAPGWPTMVAYIPILFSESTMISEPVRPPSARLPWTPDAIRRQPLEQEVPPHATPVGHATA
jgi:hypothetical protein